MILATQSPIIKDYSFVGGLVYIFSASGVDIYKPSYNVWTRLGFASLPNVTSGAVNDNGIWFGTAASGVYHCAIGNGNLSGTLKQYYALSGTTFHVNSDAINHVCGYGTALLVTHDAGADFFPAIGAPFSYSDRPCFACAVNGSLIAYASNIRATGVPYGILTIAHPTADWENADATSIRTGSTPALTSDIVNHIAYGSGDNLIMGTGAGVNVYIDPTVTSFGAGNVPYVWPDAEATQTAGDVIYLNSSDDAIIYNIDNNEAVETHGGPFTAGWIDNQADLALYDAELERHAFIDNISPAPNAVDVSRTWSLYFEIGDTINGMEGVTVKVDGVIVSHTAAALGSGFDSGFSSGFGGEGFKITYTPATASGYRKTVVVEITGEDGAGDFFSTTFSFITATVLNESPAATKPPNVIVFKDLSLVEYEDTYKGVGVNWATEKVLAYFVSEAQAEAAGTVEVENGIYHKFILNMTVEDKDDNGNNTQDIKRGDIIQTTSASLELLDQKCEVLSLQRTVAGDEILYNMQAVYYKLWS